MGEECVKEMGLGGAIGHERIPGNDECGDWTVGWLPRLVHLRT